MAVVARFFVHHITNYCYNDAAEVVLSPVVRGPENAAWASATPSGEIKMQVNNPAAADWFRQMMADKADIAITYDAAAEVEDRQY